MDSQNCNRNYAPSLYCIVHDISDIKWENSYSCSSCGSQQRNPAKWGIWSIPWQLPWPSSWQPSWPPSWIFRRVWCWKQKKNQTIAGMPFKFGLYWWHYIAVVPYPIHLLPWCPPLSMSDFIYCQQACKVFTRENSSIQFPKEGAHQTCTFSLIP